VHPIERLRYVARSSGEPADLVEEAADALQDLAGDPRALVTASRRLLDAHPECGQLWWLAARILCAADPAAAAEEARRLVLGDLTTEELAGSLPSAATVTAVASRLVVDACSLRPDCSVRLVGTPLALRRAVHRLGAEVREVAGFGLGELEEAVAGSSLVLAEALAASPNGVLVAAAGAAVVRCAGDRGVASWLVAPQGSVLPPALFEACAARSSLLGGRQRAGGAGPDPFGFDELPSETVTVQRLAPDVFTRAVTASGPGRPGEALGVAGCPAPAELTRLAG
jgi:hypothetical protein